MTPLPPRLAVVLALSLLPVAAQEVQRCEGGGTVTYANGPCPAGTAAVRTLPPAGTPSAADRKAAQQRGQQDVRNAAELERARQAEEARSAQEQERAQAKAAKHEAKCRSLGARLKQAQDDLADAARSRRAEAQRRVERAEELYRADCGAPRS